MPPFDQTNTTSLLSQFMSSSPPPLFVSSKVDTNRIMHGLGFMSSWADYLNVEQPSVLTPQIVLGDPMSQEGLEYEGFVEYAFDRLITFTNQPDLYATNLTAEIVKQFVELGTNFTSTSSFAEAFYSSGARLLGASMAANATTPRAVQQSIPLRMPSKSTQQTDFPVGPPLTLETSLKPFTRGSSLNHVDGALYLSTGDFLMRHSTPMGKTLQQFCADYGDSSDPLYGPFGPGLRYVLAGIGYRVRGGVPLGGSTHRMANYPVSEGGVSTSNNSSELGAKRSHGLRIEVPFWLGGVSYLIFILGSWLVCDY